MTQNPYAAPSVDPTPSPQQQFQNDGPQDWTVGRVVGVGVEAVKKNPGVLIGGYFLIMLIQQVLQAGIRYALFGEMAASSDPMESLASSGAIAPISLVLGVFFTIGQFRVALAAARNQPIELGMFFSGFDRLLPGVFLMLLMYLGMFVGFIFFIIPGIMLMLAWSMSFVTLADTKMGVTEMLSDSWECTKGHKMALFGFSFVAAGLFLIGALALLVGILVAYPIVMVASAEIYMCITGRRTAEA